MSLLTAFCLDRRGAQQNTYLLLLLSSDMSVVLLRSTLRGRVSPVGGIKENVLGAHRAGANKVISPWANRKDVEYDVAK